MNKIEKIISGLLILSVVGCGAIKFNNPEVKVTQIELKDGTAYKKVAVSDIKSITITLPDAPTSPKFIADKDQIRTACTDMKLDDADEPTKIPSGTLSGDVTLEISGMANRSFKIIVTSDGKTKLRDMTKTEVFYSTTKVINRAWLDALTTDTVN